MGTAALLAAKLDGTATLPWVAVLTPMGAVALVGLAGGVAFCTGRTLNTPLRVEQAG